MHLPRSVRRRIVYATVLTLVTGGVILAARPNNDVEPAAVASASSERVADLSHVQRIPDDVPAAGSASAPAPAAAIAAAPAPKEEQKARAKVEAYMVAEGDTISGIAERFGLYTDTILWANDLGPDDYLQVGQELKIPAIDGLVYVVESGDTLWQISDNYGVDSAEIADANPDVDASALQPGDLLVLPGAQPRLRRAGMVASRGVERVTAAGQFGRWPAHGPQTDDFGWRTHPVYGTSHFHDGLDIGLPTGTPVVAVAGGTVSYAGWLGGYGLVVKLDHGDGNVTMYAHLSEVTVESGQTVGGGEQIALSGNTGASTGPHLHFTVFVGGSPVDPSSWLP